MFVWMPPIVLNLNLVDPGATKFNFRPAKFSKCTLGPECIMTRGIAREVPRDVYPDAHARSCTYLKAQKSTYIPAK
eukprot:SAG31_NODE_5161_length_2706_cov_2.869582_2_plen_76_part_00